MKRAVIKAKDESKGKGKLKGSGKANNPFGAGTTYCSRSGHRVI